MYIKKIILGTVACLLSISPFTQVSATGINSHQILANEALAQVLNLEVGEISLNDVTIQTIGNYEVSLGEITEESIYNENLRNSITLTGNVSVSRPLVGGVMTATATSSTSATVHMIGARARVNNNGASISTGSWNRLNNTVLATASRAGTTRTGIGHGDHEARFSSNTALTAFNTTNRSYAP